MKVKPIISYMGGKRRLASQLIPQFPEHTCYVELFCGGAALFFMRDNPAQVEVINDVNGDLVNLYRVVQHHLEEFVRQFKWALTSRQIFEWLKDANVPGLTDIQRAARYYYLQQHAFGAKTKGQSFGTSATRPVFNLCRIEERLSDAHLRLAGVTVEHLNWFECFKKYDRPFSFFYADPPYWKVEGYGMDFGIEQYQLLAETMKAAQGKVMLSVNDHPDMRTAFDGLNIEATSLKYSVNNYREAPAASKELIIKNW